MYHLSVLARKRKKSKFAIFNDAIAIRSELDRLSMLNYYYEPKNNINNKESPEMKEARIAHERRTVEKCSKYINDQARAATSYITMANAIYPTNNDEMNTRRLCQDKAIAHYSVVLQEMQYMGDVANLDKNVLTKPALAIDKEIGYIKNWRKSDNKIASKIEKKKSEEKQKAKLARVTSDRENTLIKPYSFIND